MTIGEFFITLGFNAQTVKVKDFVKTLEEIPINAALSIAALAGIDYELIKIADNALKSAESFAMFRAQTGLSTQELQQWQIIAQQAHVSADAVASSVSTLEKNLAEIRLGRGNIAPFQLLGISPNQDAFSVLKQLRERIHGLPPAMATNLVSQMGIDPSMVRVLRLSNDEFARMGQTIRGLTSGQEGSLEKASDSLAKFATISKYLGFELIARIIQDLTTFWDILKKIQIWIPGLVVAIGALTIAFAPLIATVVGLLLLFDDLATYFQGGDSVIGVAIEGIKKLGEELKNNLSGLNAIGKVATLASLIISPGTTIAGAVGSAAAHVVNQNVTVNVHSTAPAHDVAKEVKGHIDRAASQASLQTNQQGY